MKRSTKLFITEGGRVVCVDESVPYTIVHCKLKDVLPNCMREDNCQSKRLTVVDIMTGERFRMHEEHLTEFGDVPETEEYRVSFGGIVIDEESKNDAEDTDNFFTFKS